MKRRGEVERRERELASGECVRESCQNKRERERQRKRDEEGEERKTEWIDEDVREQRRLWQTVHTRGLQREQQLKCVCVCACTRA